MNTKTPEENTGLLTVAEAAQKSGLSEAALRSAMTRGRLPFTEIYGRKLIKPEDLEARRTTVKMGRPSKKKIAQ